MTVWQLLSIFSPLLLACQTTVLLVVKWSAAEELVLHRAESNRLKKKNKWGESISLSIQRNSLHPDYGKSNRAEIYPIPRTRVSKCLNPQPPLWNSLFFLQYTQLASLCDILMALLVVHISPETHLLYWHIVLAYICHQRVFQQPSLWKYLTTTAL